MQLGPFSVRLAVRDLATSEVFYERLGFETVDGGHQSQDFPDTDSSSWRMMKNGNTLLGLFQGVFPRNVLTFNPPDVRSVQRNLKQEGIRLTSEADERGSGPAHVMLEDPDGNPILLDQQ